jgi:hypothetical protein
MRNFEIENADTEARLALINPTVAGADHDAISGFLFATKINHRMCDRRIALDRISARPEKQIAGFEIVQFERVIFLAHDRLECFRVAQPGILFARITRNIADIILLEHIIDESRAIHSAAGGIGRAVLVIKIARRQLERRSE